MPALTWPGKRIEPLPPASLVSDSVVYPQGRGYPDLIPTNRLILGDNLAVMTALLPEYEGRFNLIYADPPFFTNRKYTARIGQNEDSRRPAEWDLAEGYHDAWPDVHAYLDFLYQRLALMVRLLAPNGTLYLHLDWHADAYARLLLDELLGPESLLNEIIWVYHGPSPIKRAFNRKHDTLMAYVKGKDYTFNADAVREPYHPSTVNTFLSSPKAGFGKMPDLKRGKVPEDWWYFPVVARLHNERTGYPTQKPAALIERIILASSNPGDLVGDFFCGSGTFPSVAARLGRRFLAVDATWRAVHTTRRRLTDSPAPFTLEHEAASVISQAVPPRTKLRLADSFIGVQTALDLDFWEVDPLWAGTVFRSAAQAVRPTRTGDIAVELKIKTGPGGEGAACVRMVTVRGQCYQLHV